MKRTADTALESGARVVCIDAGGTVFRTTRQTLLKSALHFPHSGLAALVTRDEDDDGGGDVDHISVDTDPELFRHVLQLVRRPALALAAPPPFVWTEAWRAELDYWGLGEHCLTVEERAAEQQQRQQRRNLRALQQIGEEARAQVQDNEVLAVRELLDQSGYTASRDKGRETTLRVPLEKHPLPNGGGDLGLFLLKNAKQVDALLASCLQTCSVAIDRERHHTPYTFAGQSYNPKDTKTMFVTLKFHKEESNK
jgi:hypothetical protein